MEFTIDGMDKKTLTNNVNGVVSIEQFKKLRDQMKLLFVAAIATVILMVIWIIVIQTRLFTVQNVASLNALQETDITTPIHAGATYVRWGSTVCNNNTARLIYSGVAAGPAGNANDGQLTERGGGANYLCLTNHPMYMENATAEQEDARSRIYGGEYRNGKAFGNHLHDVPCVVCETDGRRTQQILVPGTYRCPDGWTNEYNGTLHAARHNNPRTTYVCMDSTPEVIDESDDGDDKASYFYPVEGICSLTNGGLPCGPYVDGKELSCAICSK